MLVNQMIGGARTLLFCNAAGGQPSLAGDRLGGLRWHVTFELDAPLCRKEANGVVR